MRGNRRRTVLRRRKAGLTDYRRRLRLLRSQKPRAVVRVSNTRTSCQLVTWAAEGDLVVLNVTGSDLVKKYSWPEDMSKKSVPASYLVGFALGKAAIAAGHEDAVLDIGLAASTLEVVYSPPYVVWSKQDLTFLTARKYFLMMTVPTVLTSMTPSLEPWIPQNHP